MVKNTKQRLFEVMGYVNPDFKVINEAGAAEGDIPIRNQQPPRPEEVPEGASFQLKTYGDLKQAINAIKLRKKGTKLGGMLIDGIIGEIPGISTAKTFFDLARVMFNKPDTVKTNTWLDKIDVDDDASKIIDDRVESGFLQAMTTKFMGRNDADLLEPNFDMNKELADYLAKNFDNRTITGIPPRA